MKLFAADMLLLLLLLCLQVLPYELLQGALAIGTVRDLEDFIISDCFYTGGCRAQGFGI
jgi:hypothetical protein